MTLTNSLFLSSLLFAIGLYGVLTRRNIIGLLMAIELMLNSAIINFVAFAYFGHRDPVAGSVFSTFIIATAAAEMAVALAIVISMHRKQKTIDIDLLRDLNG